ncbi:PucR family transcriptional regulator [Paenibacillus dakarensis]|uniref:PucR family transcriptional regulator n=1 Tax=Paenibacillus dakarensis TaxID=1527293 RepID=UPI0006D57539|nr:PucR family transcriptional regulator [Paenibacillus dakarensis]
MTEIAQILQSLKSTLDIPMTLKSLNEKEARMFLNSMTVDEHMAADITKKEKSVSVLPAPGAFYITKQGEVWFATPERHEPLTVIAAPADQVTETEVKLIGLLLSNLSDSDASAKNPRHNSKGEEEQYAQMLGEWLQERIKVDDYHASLPEEYKGNISLVDHMTPFLLVNESEHPAQTTFKSLQRLLRSYFGGEIVLIPLQDKVWIILADPHLLDDLVDDKDEIAGEGDQNLLELFCMGLYELVSNEWVGDFHIAAMPTINVQKDLPNGLRELRETMVIGRTFQVKERIHLSNGLHLERLLFSIPEVQRNRFLEEYAGHHAGIFEDAETLSTLESFFELDCNVSETAKQLYIHRNTLLYRLDKIKQETGLDVRSFGDAVLVKITLLLYKVTKRK